MQKSFEQLLSGYKKFKEKFGDSGNDLMSNLSLKGQAPQFMVISCCDSRVDPSLILQCSPGDLFIVRNIANIVPPYESDEYHHGTSAALEFGVCYLKVKHIIIMGHSQCGGIIASLDKSVLSQQNDFIGNWVKLINHQHDTNIDIDTYAKECLNYSYENCLTFPWIKSRVQEKKLSVHRWFFDIKTASIMAYSTKDNTFISLQEYEWCQD